MAEFIKVAKVSDVPPGDMKMVQANGTDVCLANVNGQIFSIENNCPHQGGPLSEGVLSGKIVTCPWHNWKLDVCTGDGVHNPQANVNCFKTKIEGDDIFVMV